MKIKIEFGGLAARSMLAVLAFVAVGSGCAAPADSMAMVPARMLVDRSHPYSVNIEVAGGRKTTEMTPSQISNEAFKEAITESLMKSRLFADITDKGAAAYHLNVIIFSIEQPTFGFSMTTKLEVGWTLTQVETGKMIWRESIRSVYTASAGAAFSGAARLQLATEGAARENIKEAIEKLARVDL